MAVFIEAFEDHNSITLLKDSVGMVLYGISYLIHIVDSMFQIQKLNFQTQVILFVKYIYSIHFI